MGVPLCNSRPTPFVWRGSQCTHQQPRRLLLRLPSLVTRQLGKLGELILPQRNQKPHGLMKPRSRAALVLKNCYRVDAAPRTPTP
ncbi:MAG: hypothetical protein AVDCRST_MAG77-4938 [uncultured Chloroflexi bacterium]|uniref:Uncharacterized protein n=1 Tax=uncultured Chloroflexota bacterium TaxID=166587 RepID=A0A6J4K1F2_9CHLR|nr:MAG: hypothetical protein AVDCRST_MAG77-4938 [uncultured Chloroflexota bacterium]